MSEGDEWKDSDNPPDVFRTLLEESREMRKKHNKMVEASIFEYNQKLFEQDQALHDAAADQADYDMAISMRLRSEIAVSRKVRHLPNPLHCMVLRQIAENLLHKADCNDRMREMNKRG